MLTPGTEDLEKVTQAVYDLMPFDGPRGSKPDWVPRGNSLKQDEARGYAYAVLEAISKPSEGALLAGYQKGAHWLTVEHVGEIWQAMIRYILVRP